jgi:hypothetical protein
VDRAGALDAVEIKSGETISADFFKLKFLGFVMLRAA